MRVSNAVENEFAGNPFSCEWLVKDALTSKNIRVGEDYVVDSKHNVLRVAGIQCFEEDGSERKLIVVESKLEISDEVGGWSFVTFPFVFQQLSFPRRLRVTSKPFKISRPFRWRNRHPMTSISGQYCFGCHAVALACLSLSVFSNVYSESRNGRARIIDFLDTRRSPLTTLIWRAVLMWNDILKIFQTIRTTCNRRRCLKHQPELFLSSFHWNDSTTSSYSI